MKCPSCGSEDVRRSRKRSLIALLQRWRGLRRYRCRECRRIFYSQLPPGEREMGVQRSPRARRRRPATPGQQKQHRLRRHATELLLFLCLVVVFYAALRYLTRVP